MLYLYKRDVFLETWFSLPRIQALSTPSFWFVRWLQKSLSRLFLVLDDVAIFLVQESTAVLSTQMSDLWWDGCFVFGSLIASSTALFENMIVSHSRLLIMIRSRYLVLRCFRVLSLTVRANSAQHQNLSSGQHIPHPARHMSHRTVKS